MKRFKKIAACCVASLMLTCAVGVSPALADTASKGNVPINRTYNVSILGGTWHNQGTSANAYSNFYHKTKRHTSTVSSSKSTTAKTASANAGSWSYATLAGPFGPSTLFAFKCTTS